jgi:hypothetical protein
MAEIHQYDYLLLVAAFVLFLCAYLLYKYDEFKQLTYVFLLLVIVAVILLRYYDTK